MQAAGLDVISTGIDWGPPVFKNANLKRVIVSHGDVIDEAPSEALAKAASDYESQPISRLRRYSRLVSKKS